MGSGPQDGSWGSTEGPWIDFLRTGDSTCNKHRSPLPRLAWDSQEPWRAQIWPSAASVVGSGVSRMLTTEQETVPS